MSDSERGSLFKQSGWMMISTTLSGALMFGVHAFSPFFPASEYGLFTALLAMVGLMMIPALGLQSTLAQQTAAVVTEADELALAGTVRTLMRWGLYLWLLLLVGVWIWSPRLMVEFKIKNPAALWITVAAALPQFWLPILLGVLQGRQNFPWLGAASITHGLGRFIAVAIVVALFQGQAAGAMGGVLFGFVASLVLALWQGRQVLVAPASAFDWKSWLARILPLTLGLGAGQFMMIADMLIVRKVFDADSTGPYGAAGMIGRGLVQFTAPLTAVMFPKLVRSAARAEPTLVLGQILKATGLLGVLAAGGCTIAAFGVPAFLDYAVNSQNQLFASVGLKLAPHRERLLSVAALIPWFVWAMLPLSLANVLISSLLARGEWKSTLWMALIAGLYGLTIWSYHPSFRTVILSLGYFNCLLLAVCWFISKRAGGARPTVGVSNETVSR